MHQPDQPYPVDDQPGAPDLEEDQGLEDAERPGPEQSSCPSQIISNPEKVLQSSTITEVCLRWDEFHAMDINVSRLTSTNLIGTVGPRDDEMRQAQREMRVPDHQCQKGDIDDHQAPVNEMRLDHGDMYQPDQTT